MKKLLSILALTLLMPLSASAINVTVPQSGALGDTLYGRANGTYSTLPIGANGDCYKIASGIPSWGSCGSGGGGGTDGNWSFFNGSGIRLATTSNQVVIGASATSSLAKLNVTGTSYFNGNVGIGTTTPYAALSVVGQAVAAYFTATTSTASTFTYASTTALTVSGTSYLGTVGSGVWNGTAIDISSYTNLTAGDALTLTGDDIDFDGGATPAGDLGGTWASPSVTDDSHAHTGSTLSGIDISSDTNLSGDSEIVLTGDALSIAASIARDSELHSAVTLTGEDYLSLSTQQITANAIDPDNLSASDFGSFTCNGTTCTVDNGAISNAMLANSTISGIALGSNLGDLTATNGTLTFSGTYNGSTARSIGLNLGNANTWTALQQFAAGASTTQLSAYEGIYVGTTATTTILGTATSTFGAGIQGTYLNITGTSATSTFARGINLSGGCFAINGTCVSGSGGSGSGTVNSGTQYQTAFYASNGTAVSGTSTLTIRDEKVGINNTDPTYPLEIGNNRLTVDSNGSIETIGNVTTNGGNVYLNYFGQTPLIGNAGGGSSSGLITYGGTDATSRLLLRSTTGSGTSDYIAMQVGNNGATEALRILNGGRIAAGTTTPFANKLLTLATSTGSNLSITDGSLTSSQWDFRNKNGILYIATSSPTTGATSTIPAIQANSTGYPSLSVGTTTSTGILNLGANPTAGAATSTIFMEKIQIQGKNSAGTLSCAYIAGTSWVIQAGACNN